MAMVEWFLSDTKIESINENESSATVSVFDGAAKQRISINVPLDPQVFGKDKLKELKKRLEK